MLLKRKLFSGPLFLLVLSLAFFIMGLVLIFSTTSAEILDIDADKSPYHHVIKQALYGVIGVGVAASLWRLGYRRVLDAVPALFWCVVLLLFLLLIPGVGREVNGAKRWIAIGSITFQPSELMKFLLPLYLIHHLLKMPGEIRELPFKQFARLALIGALPIALVAVEPNNGTAGVIGLGVVILCFLARLPFKFWGLPLLFCILVGGTFAYHMPYVSARLKVYLDPESDIRGRGHQPYQAKIAAGSGQLLGKGPGRSWQKLSYLPEAQNDYIAAIFAEEYGFVGTLTLLLCYMAFACLGFAIAMRSLDFSGFLIAAIFTFLITFQAFLNIAVVSGLLPSTGMNLPFFSQGGTSLIVNLAAVALIMTVGAQSSGEKSLA